MIAHVILQNYSLQNESFSYAVPVDLEKEIKEGMLILVPFRNKEEKAIVLKLSTEQPGPALKSILRVLNPIPVLFPYQIELAQWIADYYVCPLFKAVNLFLPIFVWEEKQEDWVERSLFIALVPESLGKGPKEKQVLDFLKGRNGTTLETLQEHIQNLSLAYLKNLAKKGLVTITAGEIIPPYFKNYDLNNITVVQAEGLKGLRPKQKEVFETIQKNSGKTFLLHGITGSGKTEIYLHLAYEQYKQKKQSLILVPEIALTPQLIAYFFKVFGKHISVLHSQLSDGERFTEWVRIKQKDSYVVIGSRSALFSPFADLGLIVLDEEHEWTYKNDQNPRYHAREVALQTARLANATVILGSATPDIESYYKAKTGEYMLLELPEKIEKK